MKKEIVKIKSVMLRDENGLFTIFDGNNKGGAIVSDLDPFVAMKKFKEGTNVVIAVKTLLEFKNKKYYVAEFIE